MAAKIPSVVRLAWQDPMRQALYPLWESRVEPMSDNETDITKNPILPKYSKVFEENDYLVLQINSDAALALSTTDSAAKIRVPVTMFNKRTGQPFESHIMGTVNSQYHFTFTDATTVAGVYYTWGIFQLPLGLRMKLGTANAFNSKVLISPYT